MTITFDHIITLIMIGASLLVFYSLVGGKH